MSHRENNQSFTTQLLVATLLIAAGVALRFYFQYLPNFAPVAALALFAGYYFRSAAIAIAVPMAVMLISDQVIGGYEWKLMIVVYAMLGLPVLMRSLVRRNVAWQSASSTRLLRSAAVVCGCSLTASVMFFVATNLAVWQTTSLYETSFAGLAQCFANAIPFFRYTLFGDLCFGTALFGGYALAIRMASLTNSSPAAVVAR